MNGPQYYVEAERLLAESRAIPANYDETNPVATLLLADATVCAVLALAAATAMAGINRMDEDDFREWDKVAGVQSDGES